MSSFRRHTDESINQTYYSVAANFNTYLPSNNDDEHIDGYVAKAKLTLNYYPDGKLDSDGTKKKLFLSYEPISDNATCVEVVYTNDANTYTEQFSKSRTLVVDGGATRRYFKDALKTAYGNLKF